MNITKQKDSDMENKLVVTRGWWAGGKGKIGEAD